MITILVLDDERKVVGLLSEVLKKEGYSIFNEPESEGLIKIIKKEDIQAGLVSDKKILEIEDSLMREKNGILYKSLLDEVERPLLESVLEKTEGNQLKAAKNLGINRNTLRSKIQKLDIDVSRWRS